MLKILRAKFHGIRVTASDLNYHGSVTLDPEQCARAGILPLEFVEIWNKNSGQRLSTYVIYGEPGSRCCVLNGAAARTCQAGDELIICASEYVADARELATRRPVVLCFGEGNRVTDALRYEVGDGGGRMSFAVRRED
ncbi:MULTISPECIES: aspartate 1-decarboxylase [unclassified Desulfovibrio]|uniref:aspartate 1-decarboxylase n=1 Tax=unclassified Desulfovibrio TaxID=2593640 RepID=UPI0013EA9B0D|nr:MULTISPECIES: aspartate 1-decarboxylase [unclassified Desulfovibrio]